MTRTSSKAIVILHCQFNSHPFEERTIDLIDQVKVGRAVSRSKPTLSNAIFDCKVLSRSHAIIRFHSNEFWLQDTNSSNGTFVNNIRISKRDDGDSCEQKIFSGDILKFGVDVVENNVTHGCIIASATLLLPDGSEARPSLKPHPSARAPTGDQKSISSEQIFKLSFFVEDITFREEALNNRLENLRLVLQDAALASELGWQAMLNEEKLLAKIYLYEQQIRILKGDLSEDSLKLQLCNLLDSNDIQEVATKTELNRILDEKCLLLKRINELEGSLRPFQDECVILKENCQSLRSVHISLSEDYQKNLDDVNRRLIDINNAKDELHQKLTDQVEVSNALQLEVENLAHQNILLRKSRDAGTLQSIIMMDRGCDFKENFNSLNTVPDIARNLSIKQTADDFLTDCVHDFELSLKFSRLLREKLSPLSSLDSGSSVLSRRHYFPTISLDALDSMVQKILKHHESAMAHLHTYLLEVNPSFTSNLLDLTSADQGGSKLHHNEKKSISSIYETLNNIEKELRTSQMRQRLLQEETENHQSEIQIMRTERNRLEALLEEAYGEIAFLQTSLASSLSNSVSSPSGLHSTTNPNCFSEDFPNVAEVENSNSSELAWLNSHSSASPLLALSLVELVSSMIFKQCLC